MSKISPRFDMEFPWWKRTLFAMLLLVSLSSSAPKLLSSHPVFNTKRYEHSGSKLRASCPLVVPRVIDGVTPVGRLEANYLKVDYVNDYEACFEKCCHDTTCNGAFMYLNQSRLHCFKTICTKDEQCLPSSQG
jgi:hypothetical protein